MTETIIDRDAGKKILQEMLASGEATWLRLQGEGDSNYNAGDFYLISTTVPFFEITFPL